MRPANGLNQNFNVDNMKTAEAFSTSPGLPSKDLPIALLNRLCGAMATISMADMDAALRETGGWEFFGPDRVLFGIDFPLGDIENGDRNYRQTINAIEAMTISDEDKKKIYEENAKKLMRLPI